LGQVSFHRLQRGLRGWSYDLVDTGRNFRVSRQPFEKR
jgi:hypothetical protein